MKALTGLVVSALLVTQGYPVSAQVRSATALTPKAALERLFVAPQLQADWFSPDFLAQIPMTTLQEGRTEIQRQMGNYREVRRLGNDFVVVFDRGKFDAKIALNSRGQIIGLMLTNPK